MIEFSSILNSQVKAFDCCVWSMKSPSNPCTIFRPCSYTNGWYKRYFEIPCNVVWKILFILGCNACFSSPLSNRVLNYANLIFLNPAFRTIVFSWKFVINFVFHRLTLKIFKVKLLRIKAIRVTDWLERDIPTFRLKVGFGSGKPVLWSKTKR